MPYSEKQMVKAPMKPSPSLIYNNLTSCAGSLLYAHIRQACTFALSGLAAGVPVAVRKVDSQHTDVIHSIAACSHNAATFLVLATDAGIQVWDKTVTHLLHVAPLPAPPADLAPRHTHFARGVAINVANDGTPHIVYGTSGGAVHAMPLSEADGKFKPPVALPPHHTSPITAIGSAYQSRQGKWTEDLGCHMVTCDEDGGLAVWEALSVGGPAGFKLITAIAPTGNPVVSVAVRRELVVAARLDGAVQLFGLRDGKLRADLGAHSRFTSCMDIHPTKDIIVTAAEDCSVAIWALPIGGQKAELLLSVCWLQAALTGVAFCGPTSDDVAVVAYDTDEVHVYKHVAK